MKTITLGIVSLVIAAAIAGAYYFPLSSTTIVQQAGSPAGSTFNSAKQAVVTFSPSTGTTTAILNTDASARLVTGPVVACTGVGTSKTAYTGTGLASLTILVGTSSTATVATTNFSPAAEVGNLTLATSSVNFLLASSTSQTATSSNALSWDANTYMLFSFNATNTATCSIGVTYIGS